MKKTTIIIKPPSVEHVVQIIPRLQKIGTIAECIKLIPEQRDWEAHYAEHKGKPFLKNMLEDFRSRATIIILLTGPNIIIKSRAILGATNPLEAEIGTIRRDFMPGDFELIRDTRGWWSNVIHGSDSDESAEREYQIWKRYFNLRNK